MLILPYEDLVASADDLLDDWKKLDGSRIFLTGAGGFFGKWLLETFLAARNKFNLDIKITVLLRKPNEFSNSYAEYIQQGVVSVVEGDIRNFSNPEKHFFTHVLHVAAGGNPSVKADEFLFDNIVEGTRNILNFARQSGVQNFLYVSSGGAYGKQPNNLNFIDEDSPVWPHQIQYGYANIYGVAKRAAETLVACYAQEYGFQYSIARAFAFVGPLLPMQANFAIGNFIHNAVKGEDIIIKGDGTPLRSYLYASDLSTWLWKMVISPKNNVYNVGSMEALSIEQLAQVVREEINPKINIQILENRTSIHSPPDRYLPSNKKIESEMGLVQKVSLRDAIKKTAKWYKSSLFV